VDGADDPRAIDARGREGAFDARTVAAADQMTNTAILAASRQN